MTEHSQPETTPIEDSKVGRPTRTRDGVLSGVVAWLESERVRYAGVARTNGLPLSIKVSVTVASDVTDTGARYDTEERELSPLSWLEYSIRFMRANLAEPPPREPSILYDYYGGERCKMWCPWAGLTPDPSGAAPYPSPEAAVAGYLLRTTLSEYLQGLHSLDRGDESFAERLANELVRLIEGDYIDYVERCPVGGLLLQEPLEFEGVTLRLMSGEETGSLAQPITFARPPFRQRPITGQSHPYRSERHLLTVKTPWRKTDPDPRSFRAGKVVLAMQLLGFEPRGEGRSVAYTEPIMASWMASPLLLVPKDGTTFQTFAADDLRAAVSLAELIPDEVFERPKTRMGIALHRFRSAVADDSPADAIIDLATALEAVLVQDDKELAFKLRLFGAYYIGGSPAERAALFRDFKTVYELRSALVHGTLSPAERATLEPAQATARRITGRVLVKVLREGLPTLAELTALSLA